ncbi:hypothetical protein L598_001800000760 [Mesorhizobium sp. J18]|uniref:hypothetical protein n=1 Tax=Mesorhizobium sp. J18 TaxID=935263 RepID=UPI00119A8C01|nr:hypothetical protein [Mesorhizobium sp. J18]TWG98490.1 hypothetical protein L598_001800000760 [Mesorhizobium sp. J18]
MTEGEVATHKGNRARWFMAGVVATCLMFAGFMYLDGYFNESSAEGVTADMPKGILLEKK